MKQFLWLAVGLGLATYLGLTLWLGLAGLVYPYQLDYGEGIVLWFTQQLAHGQSIYKGLTDFPYASSNYPPVAMFLSAALMPILGDGYAGGRLLNFASALIVAGLIFRIVQAETQRRSLGALAALFFLGSPYIYHWVPLFRVDLIGLAFAVVGVYFVWKFSQQSTDIRRQTLYFVLFTLSFLLALFTKHTLFAAPAAAFLALWMRNRKLAITFALLLGASGGGLYLLIDSFTRGGFTLGLIESNATVFLFDQLLEQLKNFAITFPILILLGVWGWLDRACTKSFGVLEWYALTALAFLVLAGRTGAWENYFFEVIVIIAVFTGFALAKQSSSVLRPLSLVLPLLLLLQLGLMWRDHDPRIAADLIAQEYPANQQLAALLKQTPGIVISEDMGALATSGKPLAYYTFQYSSLARSGKWDQAWELDGLRDGKFPLVILERGTREDVDHYRRFTREFVSVLDRYYIRTQTIGNYQIYTPAPPLRLQSANFGDAIALVGWQVQPETLAPGNLQLEIVWQAQRTIERRYKVFVQLVQTSGAKVTQDNREPRQGEYPTTRWARGEMVREVYALDVPAGLAPGKYLLKIGWYEADSGDRLPVETSVDDSFALTTFEVK